MLPSEVKLKDLKTWYECQQAIDALESNYHNVYGGIDAWMSGRNTYLNKATIAKIKSIEKKQSTFSDDEF